MNIKEILGYHADNHRSYQTGEGTEAPIFIYADADYEVGDGKCGLHETAKQANEPAIVYVRADSFMSRNEWLQERIDILTTANLWKARAERAEAKNNRLRKALADLRKTAALLQQNALGCATNHYGQDFQMHGMPWWLVDTAASIERAALAAMEAANE